MKTSSMYLFAAVAVACVAFGSSLKCWKCDSTEESKCLDPFNSTQTKTTLMRLDECVAGGGSLIKSTMDKAQGKEMKPGHCVKITHTNADGKVKSIVRTCGQEDAGDTANKCIDTVQGKETMTSCKCGDKDGCNAANANFGFPAAIVAVVLAKMF